jgi:hypothetical protein
MLDLPVWMLSLSIPLGALLGVIITVLVTRKNAREANQAAAHEELMRTLRWAAELAVSSDDAEARLGVLELERLGADPDLRPGEQELIDAALRAAAYADQLAVQSAGPDAEVVVLDEDVRTGPGEEAQS